MLNRPAWGLLIFAALFTWARPVEADLPGYDDAYYARKALEVIRTGDWLGLPFNGAPTFDNPPLGIWAQSISFLFFEASPAAARFPSAVYGVLTALLTFCWIRKRGFAVEIAFGCAALLLCNPLYLKYLRRGMLEMGLLFWCLLALYLWESRPLSRMAHGASGFFFGMAFLTKSALALAVPAGLLLGWYLDGDGGRERVRGWGAVAGAGFLLAVGPWIVAMALSFGGAFFRGHFGWLLWGEGVGGSSDTGRLASLGLAAGALLPLSALFLLSALFPRAASKERRRSAVPFSLAVAPVAAVTLMGPRKLWYFLPALPGMAAAAAIPLGFWMERCPGARDRVIGWILAIWALAAAAIVALPIPLHRDRTADVRAAAAEARARIDAQTPVWLFFPGETCRWNVRNAFLWYADRRIRGCEGEGVSYNWEAGEKWVLTSAAGEKALSEAGRSADLWFERGDLRLLSLESI